jgi:hypothetical protein
MSEILICAFTLAMIYQVKHFLADYVFKNAYMLKKGNPDWSFLKPLFAHCAVHGGFTFIVAIIFLHAFQAALALAAFDIVLHFIMDRLKAAPKYLGRYHPSTNSHQNHLYWVAFGFDQMVHHMTHIVIVGALIYLKYQPF